MGRLYYPKTCNMNNATLIRYLQNVHEDIMTKNNTGYFSTFVMNQDEISTRINSMSGKLYYTASGLIDAINDEYHNTISHREFES
ncbi:MAG: hypothetical protein ACP5NV_00575 [Candidatus Woesearchaeota archaeon]